MSALFCGTGVNAEYKGLRATIAAIVKARQILETRIKALMALRGIRQTDLVEAIGLSDSWLTGFFKGRNDIAVRRLDQIAGVLKVEVVDLFIERDLISQSGVGQRGLIQGAPRDPAARASYFRELLEAFESVSAALLDTATRATEQAAAPAESTPASGRARHRPARAPRAGRKLKPPPDRH
jgi:transcriptional regulator with XRE-family HTH domain